jgi:hypothetical protein
MYCITQCSGTVNFSLSRTGTVLNYGSGSGTVINGITNVHTDTDDNNAAFYGLDMEPESEPEPVEP